MSHLYAREVARRGRSDNRFELVVVDVYQRGAGDRRDDIRHLSGMEVVAPCGATREEVDALVATQLLQLQVQALGDAITLRDAPVVQAERGRVIDGIAPAVETVAAASERHGLAVALQVAERDVADAVARAEVVRKAADALLEVLPADPEAIKAGLAPEVDAETRAAIAERVAGLGRAVGRPEWSATEEKG